MSRAPWSGRDSERLTDIFGEAIELPPGARGAFLDMACGASPDLRAEVESLLSAHEQANGFMNALDMDRGAALVQATSDAEPIARRVGPYQLVRELGRGGMGIVFLAERVEGGFGQRAVVKLIKRGMDSDAILRRFLRERQILAGLEHVNVARLFDGGVTDDGQPYFAMEYVDGEPLTAYCDRRGLSVEQRLSLFADGCRVVQHAHSKLVVHRDLKPSNILVTGDGQLKLLDFGIAKLLGEEDDATALTQAGMRILTLQYAAPEQVRGDAVTTAADIYALGVILYESLTGRLPFDADRLRRADLARAVCDVEPRPPSAAVAAFPRRARRLRGDLDTIVLKALSKDPSRRYASAEALAEDVRRHLAGHPVQARRETMAYVSAKFVRRHKIGVAAGLVATLSMLLGLVGTTWQAMVAAEQRDRARLAAERAETVKTFLVDLFKASDPVEAKGEAITARELLDRGTDRIEKDLAGHDALQAELFETVAHISYSIGLYQRVRMLGERSVEHTRRAYGSESPQVAEALDTLGWMLHSAGDYAAAEDSARQALALRRRLLPADSLELATSLELLGVLVRQRANLAEAEALHRAALAIRRQRLGPEHPRTALSLSNLANVLYMKGDYTGAVAGQREVVHLQRQALGDRHGSVATSLLSLGVALLQNGDLAGAEAAYRESLSIRQQLFGEEHPSVSESLHHLAGTLHATGDLSGAEMRYRQVLAMDRTLKGDGHPDVGVVLTNLGNNLAQQARLDEALPLFDEAVVLFRRQASSGHTLLARTLERQASALIDQRRSRDALRLLNESLALNKARYGVRHPAVASVLATSARARVALGEHAEGERLFREALDMHRETQRTPNIATVEILTGLGEALLERRRTGEAEPFLRQAVTYAARLLPERHWRRGEAESALGVCLSRLGGHIEEARVLLVSGDDKLRSALGDTHPAARRAHDRLAVRRR